MKLLRTILEGEAIPFGFVYAAPNLNMNGRYYALFPFNFLYRLWWWSIRKVTPSAHELEMMKAINDANHHGYQTGWNKCHEHMSKAFHEETVRWREGR